MMGILLLIGFALGTALCGPHVVAEPWVWTPWLGAMLAAGAVNITLGGLLVAVGAPGVLPWLLGATGMIFVFFGPDVLKLVGV